MASFPIAKVAYHLPVLLTCSAAAPLHHSKRCFIDCQKASFTCWSLASLSPNIYIGLTFFRNVIASCKYTPFPPIPHPPPHPTKNFPTPTIFINSLVELKFKKYILKSCAIDWFLVNLQYYLLSIIICFFLISNLIFLY